MKLKTLQILAIVCVMTLSIGILAVKAESTSTNGFKATIINKFEKKDVRNPLVEKAREMRDIKASTTAEIRDIRREDREEIKDIKTSSTERIREMRDDSRASTTRMIKEFKGERKEIMKKMQLRVFEARKNSLVRELTGALKNLTGIRSRISERITKAEAGGRTMTEAKAKLVIADAKLATAKAAVDALASYNYASSTITTTASSTATTTEISLDRPRKIGDDAIKAVKDARDSLKDVVSIIAHNMGLGDDRKNTTATTTASTTIDVVTASSTATTTASTTSN
jgi:hypothetical protein